MSPSSARTPAAEDAVVVDDDDGWGPPVTCVPRPSRARPRSRPRGRRGAPRVRRASPCARLSIPGRRGGRRHLVGVEAGAAVVDQHAGSGLVDLGVEADGAAVGRELRRRWSAPRGVACDESLERSVERSVADHDRLDMRAVVSSTSAAAREGRRRAARPGAAGRRRRATSGARAPGGGRASRPPPGRRRASGRARASGGPSRAGARPPRRAPASGPGDPLDGEPARHPPPERAEIRASAIVTTKAASAALPAASRTPVAQKKRSAAPRTSAAAKPTREILRARAPGRSSPQRAPARKGFWTRQRGRPSPSRGEQPTCLQVDHSPVLEKQNTPRARIEIPAPSALESGLLTVGGSPPADLPLGVLFLLVVVVVDAAGCRSDRAPRP